MGGMEQKTRRGGRPLDPAVQADPRRIITLYLPESLLADLNRYAEQHGISRAEAYRALMARGLRLWKRQQH